MPLEKPTISKKFLKEQAEACKKEIQIILCRYAEKSGGQDHVTFQVKRKVSGQASSITVTTSLERNYFNVIK